MRRILFLGGLVLIAIGVWLSVPLAQSVLAGPEADADAGKTFYAAASCKSCHGTNAEGRFGVPLAGTTLSASDVISEVRNNAAKHPIYRTEQISDTALTNMTDYFKTLTKPVTFTAVVYQPKPGDEPGKVLFNQKMCGTCHGENGERILAQSVRSTGRTTVTQEDIEKQLRNPRRNMPAQSEQLVSKADVAAMAPFIKAAVDNAPLTPQPAGTPGAQSTVVPTSAPTSAPTAVPTVAPPAATATSAPVAAVVPTTAPVPANPPTQTAADSSSNLPLIIIAAIIVLALIGGYYYLRRNPR